MAKIEMLEATTTEKCSNEENAELSKVLQYLAPWREKTLGNYFGYQDDGETLGAKDNSE